MVFANRNLIINLYLSIGFTFTALNSGPAGTLFQQRASGEFVQNEVESIL